MCLYTPSLKNKGQGNYECLPSHCFHFLLLELSDEGLFWNNVEGVCPGSTWENGIFRVPGHSAFASHSASWVWRGAGGGERLQDSLLFKWLRTGEGGDSWRSVTALPAEHKTNTVKTEVQQYSKSSFACLGFGHVSTWVSLTWCHEFVCWAHFIFFCFRHSPRCLSWKLLVPKAEKGQCSAGQLIWVPVLKYLFWFVTMPKIPPVSVKVLLYGCSLRSIQIWLQLHGFWSSALEGENV